jgi:hypothetical protein
VARLLIQRTLESLNFDDKHTILVIKDIRIDIPFIEIIKTTVPKPSKNMYQTKRGKWINCK